MKVPLALLDQLRQWRGATPASAAEDGLAQTQAALPLLPPLPPLPHGHSLWIVLHRMWRQPASVRSHTDCRGVPYEARDPEPIGTERGGGACTMGLAVARLVVARDNDALALATSSGWVDVYVAEPGPNPRQLESCSLAGRATTCVATERVSGSTYARSTCVRMALSVAGAK